MVPSADPRTEPAIDAVTRGLQEALETGTTLLGEIAQPSWEQQPFEQSPLGAELYLEFIGLARERVSHALTNAVVHLQKRSTHGGWRPGLSPHAPYTVNQELLTGLVDLAAERGATVAMHLAESREEVELLRTGRGAFHELLNDRGVWQEGALPTNARALDYLHNLSRAPRSLVVHGNYLDRDEIQFLAEQQTRMAVVYCPRTHAYFSHDRYPLVEMLQAGVRVAVGTDSRASNPDLNLLSELRWIARSYPEISSTRILELGTIEGARALGREHEGRLETGCRANLALVELPADNRRDAYELLLTEHLPAVATMIDGVWVWGKDSTIAT